MKLVLIRHAKTMGNVKKRYIGITDEPIIENTKIEKEYPQVDIVYASPMERCLMTAKMIYPKKKICIVEDFTETNFGSFENKAYDELKDVKEYIEWVESEGKKSPPGGESRFEMTQRVLTAHNKIINESKENAIAYVVHGGTIMVIMQAMFGRSIYDYQVDNLKGYLVDIETNSYKLLEL